MKKHAMTNDQLPRILGFGGIAIAATLLVGLVGLNWFIALVLAFLASAVLVANTLPSAGVEPVGTIETRSPPKSEE